MDNSGDWNRRSTANDQSAYPPEAGCSGPSVPSDATSRQANHGGAGQPAVQLITALEASRALSISQRTLWTLTKRGEVRCIRIGRCVRYAPGDLRAFIASRRNA